MKKLLFLFASLVLMNTTASATTNTIEGETSIINNVRGYGNSFIFNEAGIEFSVFLDGQFDFFIPNHGPNVTVGINSPHFSLSFNNGFDYNPFVQYDSFGAIIQIENTPIFYDFNGRVNQIGNIFINYNGFNRINRIGGLSIFYRNNEFWRQDGFINNFNRSYVWRPWHRFYGLPQANFCIINVNPYRQFYAPVRHIYYRPYTDNVRHYNIGRRGNNNNIGRRTNATRNANRYAQTPRNRTERSIRTRVRSNNVTISSTRATRLRDKSATLTRTTRNANGITRPNTRRGNQATTIHSNTRVTTPTRTNTTRNANVTTTRSNTRVNAPTRTRRNSNTISAINTPHNANKSNNTMSNNRTRATSTRQLNATPARILVNEMSQNVRHRSTIKNKIQSSSVKRVSNTSRKNNQSSTRSRSKRSRG